MSPRQSGTAEISGALPALATISSLVDQGRQEFDLSQTLRLALTMCWVSAGSQLKQFVRVRGISAPAADLSAPIRLRDKLSYQPLSDLDTDILWNTCIHERRP